MRQIIEQIIDALGLAKKENSDQRPCSRYAQAGAYRLIEDALGCEPVADLLQHVPAGVAADLSAAQRQQLKAIVDRLDQYGALVNGWRTCRCPQGQGCRCVPTACLKDLETRLTFWVRRNLPTRCQQQGPQVVAALLAALRAAISHYTFQADLLDWAVPIWVEALWPQLEQLAKQSARPVDVTDLRQSLRPAAEHILDHLRAAYGIDGIDAAAVVNRTMLLVIRAVVDDYNDEGELEVSTPALRQLKSQLKLHTLFYLEPNLSHNWGLNPAGDSGEWQKRRRLVEVFCDLVPDE